MIINSVLNWYKTTWFYWRFVISKNCNHVSSGLRLIDFGRNKAEFCVKCGKCLKMLSDYEK